MDGVARCDRYVAGVLSGDILAPETIKQACRRYEEDKKRDDIYLDEEAANAAVENAELMRHVKGRWRGKKIHLEDWQCFRRVNVFGWKRTKDGLRRFRYVYLFVPRKNGKSLDLITDALIMLCLDGEQGSEVYLGATSQDQATKLLFKPAQQMVKLTPEFADVGLEVNASSLVIPETFSTMHTVIRKPDDGYNPHFAGVDEYHEHDTDEQWSTFDTGMGAREQPILMTTTTAGSNLGGPCMEYHEECRKILNGAIEDDSTFVMIYEPDKDDEWQDEHTLRKVNPNMGVSVSEDYLLDQLKQARQSARKQNAFRTKHLNQWVGARTAWMNMLAWRRAQKDLSLEDFEGCDCHIGLDLASKVDLAAKVLVFKRDDIYYVFGRFYIPEEAVEENPQYQRFREHLTITEGEELDFAFVEEDLRDDFSRYNVISVAYDPYKAAQLSQRMRNEGLPMIEFGQTVKNMSEPMKELEAAVRGKRLEHPGCPVMNWCMGNVQARLDEKDNIYPTKERKDSPNKIDGAVGAIMGIGRWMVESEEGTWGEYMESIG